MGRSTTQRGWSLNDLAQGVPRPQTNSSAAITASGASPKPRPSPLPSEPLLPQPPRRKYGSPRSPAEDPGRPPDQHVVGQQIAKRRLALGVSNHFKRVVDTWDQGAPYPVDRRPRFAEWGTPDLRSHAMPRRRCEVDGTDAEPLPPRNDLLGWPGIDERRLAAGRPDEVASPWTDLD